MTEHSSFLPLLRNLIEMLCHFNGLSLSELNLGVSSVNCVHDKSSNDNSNKTTNCSNDPKYKNEVGRYNQTN
jgi:hypothetical protein